LAQVELDAADTLATQVKDRRLQGRGHRKVQFSAQDERVTAIAHACLNFKTGLTPFQGHVSLPQVVLR
jgi:hypothetical protein